MAREPWQVPLVSLGNTLSEARELAAVLEETLGVRVDYGTVIHRSATTPQLRGHTFKERLLAGIPIPIDDRSINWSLLRGVVSTESLKDGESDPGAHPGHVQLEVNSGGRVFFCFFAPSCPGEPEGVAVLKFGPNRLLMQAEQFANELTRHLDICAPDCRIVRQAGPSSEEWKALTEACVRLGSSGGGGVGGAAELASELAQMPVALLMEYCPGRPLLECEEAFLVGGMSPEARPSTFEELGRLFLLDAVLGNADRLPCGELCWRGNPNNVLFGREGSRCASHIVAIDSCVQRRPPAARVSAEDAGVDRLAQLLLTDQDFALELLRGSVLTHSPPGLAALAATPSAGADAFRRGFRDCLRLVDRIKGLLEMMYSKMDEWSVEFIKDIKELRPELPIPNPALPGPASGSSSSVAGNRLVAHYTGLNIRVSPAPTGSVSGGGGGGGGNLSARNRSQLGWGGSGAASGNSSSMGSPVRARPFQSPYLTSTLRGGSRSRNSSLGGGGALGGGLPDGTHSDLSAILRRRGSLAGAAASRAAVIATAGAAVGGAGSRDGAAGPGSFGTAEAIVLKGDALGGKRAVGLGASGGNGSSGLGCVISPFAAGGVMDSTSGGESAVPYSPKSDLRRNQRLRQRSQQQPQQRQRSDEAGGGRNRDSSGGTPTPASQQPLRPTPLLQQQQQHIKRHNSDLSPEAAATVAEMPEWLARSPYLVLCPGGGKAGSGGLTAMAGRWKGLTPPSSRRCASVCVSSRSAPVSGANTSNPSISNSSNSCTTSSSSNKSHGTAPAGLAKVIATPQSRIAAVTGGGMSTATAPSPAINPVLPRLARLSSPAGAYDSDEAVPQAGAAPVRRVTDIGGGSAANAARAAMPECRETIPTAASDVHEGHQNGGGDGGVGGGGPAVSRPMENSPVRVPLRIRIVGSGGGVSTAADGLNYTTPNLRHCRSFGLLRSPRHTFLHSNSPRRMLSPATPKFRSPILDPLPLADLTPLGSAPLPQDGTAAALQGAYCSDGGGAAVAVSCTTRTTRTTSPSQAWAPKAAPAATPHPSSLRSHHNHHHHLHQTSSDAGGAPAAGPIPTTAAAAVAAKPPLPRAGSLRTPLASSVTSGSGGGGGGAVPASPVRQPASPALGAVPMHAQTLSPQGRMDPLQRRDTLPQTPVTPTTMTTTTTQLKEAVASSPAVCSGDGGAGAGGAPAGGLGREEPGFKVPQGSPTMEQRSPVTSSGMTSTAAMTMTTPAYTGSSPLGHFARMRPDEDAVQRQLQDHDLQGQKPGVGDATPPLGGSGGERSSAEPATPFCFHIATGSTAIVSPRSLSLACTFGPPSSALASTPPTVGSVVSSSTALPPSRPSPLSRTPLSASATPCTPAASGVGTSGASGPARTTLATTVSVTPASAISARSAAMNVTVRRNSGGGRGRPGGGIGSGSGTSVATRSLYRAASRGTPGGLNRVFVARGSPSKVNPYDQFKSDMSLTLALKSITSEARKDDLLSNRVQHWKELFRNRGEELKAAVGEWQSRHRLDKVLTTGFLDGTHPIVDTYELKVRLEHMLRRLQVLQEAAGAEKPSEILSGPGALFLGGAVAADSHHILRHLGITHIVNATEELLLPDPSAGFVMLRVALRDVDDEDISQHFRDVCDFIQSCHSSGGNVLVHCSEGKSRSVTLVLAYLMRVKRWRLKTAFEHVKSRRPVACPNAGFMSKLLLYERDMFGDNSHIPQQLKKAKPDPIMCPVCGSAVGISSASLAVHLKRLHHDITQSQCQPHLLAQAQGRAATATAAALYGSIGGTASATSDSHLSARGAHNTRGASAAPGLTGMKRVSVAAAAVSRPEVEAQPKEREATVGSSLTAIAGEVEPKRSRAEGEPNAEAAGGDVRGRDTVGEDVTSASAGPEWPLTS